MAWSGAPFIKYDITGLKEFASGARHKAEGTAMWGEAEEGAGQRVCSQLGAQVLRHVDMGHAAKNTEL